MLIVLFIAEFATTQDEPFGSVSFASLGVFIELVNVVCFESYSSSTAALASGAAAGPAFYLTQMRFVGGGQLYFLLYFSMGFVGAR